VTTASFIRAKTVLTPDGLREGLGVKVENGRITAVTSAEPPPAGAEVVDFGDAVLSPGFVDIQVNGGGGVLFNDRPDEDALRTIAKAHRRFGTTSILATLISDTPGKRTAAMDAVSAAVRDPASGIAGLHLEGPFLNAAKKGIHDAGHFAPLTDAAAEELASFKGAPLLLTLAPETISIGTIARLSEAGIRVAAGHTEASYEQARKAIAAGLTGFTHLFNAMPPLLSRAPGPIGAALESGAWCSIIADGHHVHPAALGTAIRSKADGRIILVSDAMQSVGTDAEHHRIAGQDVRLSGGRLTGPDGTLAGAHLTLLEAVRFLVREVQIPLGHALRMATLEPARFMGIEGEVGQITPGAFADFAVLGPDLGLRGVVFRGQQADL
jgi:N-acetylglucosamine-6-phosphate deacetylase